MNAQNQDKVPIPTQAQLNWQNAELAALLCIDLHSFDGKLYVQKEARVTPIEDYNIFNPLDKLVDMYYRSVGHNTTLILGVTPNSDGLMPEPDVERLREFGEEIKRRFEYPIKSISGTGKTINLKLSKKQRINQVVLMEDIAQGERVRTFVLQGKVRNKWQTIFEGTSIGHKFIHVFEEIEVSDVRLMVKSSIGDPKIKSFEVFNI